MERSAHLSRAGDGEIPKRDKTVSFDIDRVASMDFPEVYSERIDALACDNAQPVPLHAIDSIIPFLTAMSIESESPQERLLDSA